MNHCTDLLLHIEGGIRDEMPTLLVLVRCSLDSASDHQVLRDNEESKAGYHIADCFGQEYFH